MERRMVKRGTNRSKEQAMATKSDPIIIDAPGMRIWVDYRRSIGRDEGLTFVVTVAGEQEVDRILRFKCCSKTPHCGVGSVPKSPVHDMNIEDITDPGRWTLEQLKTRLPSMVAEAGYADIAKAIDQPAIAQSLARIKIDISAKL